MRLNQLEISINNRADIRNISAMRVKAHALPWVFMFVLLLLILHGFSADACLTIPYGEFNDG